MYEWCEAKLEAEVRKAFEIATKISWEFEDTKIRSAYVLFAALYMEESLISQMFLDMYMRIVPCFEKILGDKGIFEIIFGADAAERFFKASEEIDEDTEKTDTHIIDDDTITQKVIDVMASLIYSQNEDIYDSLEPAYSDKLEEACDKAFEFCRAKKEGVLDLSTIIYYVLQNKDTSAYRFMAHFTNALSIDVEEFIEGYKVAANISENFQKQIVIPASLTSCLELLNSKYQKGDEITILGRNKEIYKSYNIFSKKTKRNAILVGEPGVGKTAIVEAITQQIVNETCPKEFLGYNVLSLDVTSMVAGTKYRGEFEAKVALLKKFLEDTSNVILFVDEIHQMLGAGSAEGSGADLSGSLKPALSRDDVIVIGATTNKEYNSILSRDGALKRRFEVINVKEPKNNEVKAMIEAKIKCMEEYHKVKMPRTLVDYIILCASCFNLENKNPDKTLDLCDRSMAVAKLDNKRKVTKACINKVYTELFEKQCNITSSCLKETAYHEIGHYVVTRFTKLNNVRNVVAVSIIPAADWVGVNVYEAKDSFEPCDREYAEARMMCYLAGRVAQFKISKSIDSGATQDLMYAKQFAKAVITEYGMDDGEYKNIYLMDSDLLNEKLTDAINQKVNDYIDKMYKKTELFIDAHWKEIDSMAKYLMKKKIVTSEELEQFVQQ